jgi:dTDP-4-amino-4,6-dideoxygalactose transaminase
MKKATAAATKPAKSVRPSAKKPRAVPMLDLSRQYEAIKKDVTKAMNRVCASQHYILGEDVTHFENEAAKFLGVKYAIGCASGTDAIWLALIAAGIQPSDEVITTPFSFFATASTIVRAGAKPIFVDVDPETLNIDPKCVEDRIRRFASSEIKGIMPVHLYGQCAQMDELNRIASDHKLKIVEDAAQAFGATWRGKPAGGLGTAGAFSFYPTKNLSCYGDGGLITTNDEKVAAHSRSLRAHGSTKRYYHDEIGWNSRLDSLQAAILNVKLKHIEDWNKARNKRADAYDILLKSSGLLASPGGAKIAPVRILKRTPQAGHIFHQYVVRVERRDELKAFLDKQNIGNMIYYPLPLHLQKCFAYLGYAPGDLPESEKAAKDVIALPIFPELTSSEQSAVVGAMEEFYS